MSVTVSSLESDALTALRSFLLQILSTNCPGIEVVRGLTNRVPEPVGSDYVVMTPHNRPRLATDTTIYNDNGTLVPGSDPPAYSAGQMMLSASTDFVVQLDVHGPSSGDNAGIISTLLRSDYAFQTFATAAIPIAPLYTSDPVQTEFVNGEMQYEERWTLEAHVQVSPIVTVPIQFAHTLTPTVIDVVATYGE